MFARIAGSLLAALTLGALAGVPPVGNRFGSPLSATGQSAGRTIDLCSQGDPICSEGRDRSAHSNDEMAPYPGQAASFIAGRV